MTTGTLLFYGGFVLLALTIILAVIFALRPPKYTPENEAIRAPGDPRTQPLKNGYPTGRITARQEPYPPIKPAPAPSGPETALLTSSEETALLNTPTEPLPEKDRA